MQITRQEQIFHPIDQTISIEKSWGDRVHCSCVVHAMTEIFLEYQKSLFEDFFSDIHEQLDEEVSFNTFRKRFEIAIQEFNLKIATFAAKIKQEDQFVLKGFIQIIIDGEYLSSFIGPIGVIILRKKKLAYMMVNDVLQTAKISSFADVIEGDVRDDDQIIITGLPIETYIDSQDVASILQQSQLHEVSFLEELYSLLSKRVTDGEITALYQYSFLEHIPGLASKLSHKFLYNKHILANISHYIHRYRHETMIFVVGILMTFLGYWAISGYLGQQQPSRFVDTQGQTVTVTIKDIQKDIEDFDRISLDSDEKLKKYNEIQSKLSVLEQEKKQQFDVLELKKILEQKYFKGFNVSLFSTVEELGSSLYQFSDQEKNMLGAIKKLFWKNGIFVAGEKGVLLNAINATTRGILVGAPVGKTLTQCTSNLKKDGFFCQDASYQFYNTNRQGFTQLSVIGGGFPVGIKDMQTFRTTSLFTLVEDKQLNAKGVFLLKYQLQPGKQDIFQAPTEYIQKSLLSGNTIVGTGGSATGNLQSSFPWGSLAVDGSFLLWDSKHSQLHQFWRPGLGPELSSREMPLVGGNAITKEFSDQTRIITSQESKYIYLFDPIHQSFVVYKSSPLKNNEAVNSSYKLQYFYSFKFALGDTIVRDIFVREGEKPFAYVLTDQGIYEIKLYDYVDQYSPKQ